ncbi:Putative ribonuclease H protein At1g65750 [Linum perenne]
MQEPDKLWVRVLQSKYFKTTSAGLTRKNRSIQSPLWRGLTGEWGTMLLGARSAIRDGRGTAFWTDRWVDSGARLMDLVDGADISQRLDECVADYASPDGEWDYDKLALLLPDDAIKLVIGISPPNADRGDDQWTWGEERNGLFSIKSAYRIICKLENSKLEDPWLSVWKWGGPNRIKFFLWLVVQEKIMTNSVRLRRHFTTDESCDSCPGRAETVLHVLRDCKLAMDVWSRVREFDCSSTNWKTDLKTWSCHFLKSSHGILFGFTCWLIWKARNDRVFAGTRPNPLGVAMKAHIWLKNAEDAAKRNAFVLGNVIKRRETEISWDPGPPGWVTLNTDGSVIPSRAAATAGGLLRDEMGRCLLAYTVNLGNCSITRAELRGAIEGLKRTWDAGFRRVVLLLDSKAAISLLNGSQGTAHQHGMEVLQFRELLDRDWTIQIKHTYREGNHAADFLASIGYDYPFGSHTISISDCNLGYFIRYDCMGISETRSVLIND